VRTGVHMANASSRAEDVLERQDRFLRAYAELGTVRNAAKVAEIGRTTVEHWIRDDLHEFKGRYEHARYSHREYLESKMFALIEEMKPGQNPTLLIFALNGAWPEKYKMNVAGNEDNAKQTLSEIRKLAKEAKEVVVPNGDDGNGASPIRTDAV
jgi:hypothetical protein